MGWGRRAVIVTALGFGVGGESGYLHRSRRGPGRFNAHAFFPDSRPLFVNPGFRRRGRIFENPLSWGARTGRLRGHRPPRARRAKFRAWQAMGTDGALLPAAGVEGGRSASIGLSNPWARNDASV